MKWFPIPLVAALSAPVAAQSQSDIHAFHCDALNAPLVLATDGVTARGVIEGAILQGRPVAEDSWLLLDKARAARISPDGLVLLDANGETRSPCTKLGQDAEALAQALVVLELYGSLALAEIEVELAEAQAAATAQTADLQAQITRLQALVELAQEAQAQAEAARTALQGQLDAEQTKSRERAMAFQAQIARLESLLADARDAQRKLETQVADAETEGATLAARLRDELTETWTASAALQEALDDALEARRLLEEQLNRRSAQYDALHAEFAESQRLVRLLRQDPASQSETQAALDGARTRLSDFEQLLAEALLRQVAAEETTETQRAEIEELRAELAYQIEISTEAQRQAEVLSQQVAQLNGWLEELQALLDTRLAEDRRAEIQMATLGQDLNAALAQVAAQKAELARIEAERARIAEELAAELAARNETLEEYQSEFFRRMNEVLADVDGVEIRGDRFVFASSVLFDSGQSQVSLDGINEIYLVAQSLKEVIAEIPDEIDWIIRVDGHTDNQPIRGDRRYFDNWELSQARARSVVLHLNQFGIPFERLSANGFGEFQPVDTADTPEARARNRRIELKLTER